MVDEVKWPGAALVTHDLDEGGLPGAGGRAALLQQERGGGVAGGGRRL